MKMDKIYGDLKFNADFSVEDWNSLIKIKLGKYFINESIFNENMEVLRTEMVNYIRLCAKPEYFKLFEWTYDLYKMCISIDKSKTLKIMADSFVDISDTDLKWMTNVLTQPDYNEFSERDKISYFFKVIDETLEGVFKPRFKLLDKLANLKLGNTVINNANFSFGRLINDFPTQFNVDACLFLQDPIFSISTNQWRNIAAHRSFDINTGSIVVEYGSSNIQMLTISYDEFYKIVYWTQDIYRVIRLGQVLTDLNYIEDIVNEAGGTNNITVRFESSLLHLIHNMQIVGFEFVSTEEQANKFCIKVKGKINQDVKSSLIHASQCLDRLSCAIYDDKFVRDKFTKTQIGIMDDNGNKLASATMSIQVALKKVNREISLEEYLSIMEFEIDGIRY